MAQSDIPYIGPFQCKPSLFSAFFRLPALRQDYRASRMVVEMIEGKERHAFAFVKNVEDSAKQLSPRTVCNQQGQLEIGTRSDAGKSGLLSQSALVGSNSLIDLAKRDIGAGLAYQGRRARKIVVKLQALFEQVESDLRFDFSEMTGLYLQVLRAIAGAPQLRAKSRFNFTIPSGFGGTSSGLSWRQRSIAAHVIVRTARHPATFWSFRSAFSCPTSGEPGRRLEQDGVACRKLGKVGGIAAADHPA
jgi:hypothetical protein